jgi:hypothetical protein
VEPLEAAGSDRNRLPAKYADGAGVILEDARGKHDLIASICDRLADTANIQLCKLIAVPADLVGDTKQDFATASGRQVVPGLIKNPLRATTRTVNIIDGRAGNFGERKLVGRINQLHWLVRAPAVGAVDVRSDR